MAVVAPQVVGRDLIAIGTERSPEHAVRMVLACSRPSTRSPPDLDETSARRFLTPEKVVDMYSSEPLERHTTRAHFPDRRLVAYVSFFASGGSPMPITVRYWFETETLGVGWGHLFPTPGWRYGFLADARALPVPFRAL